MNKYEFARRTVELLAEERDSPVTWWYISFATDEKFLGAALVEGRGMVSAILRTHQLKINPGGEAQGLALPGEIPPVEAQNRLLSFAECERLLGKMNKWNVSEDGD